MKILRKSIAVIIICLMVISCIPLVSAENMQYNGFKYSIENGEVTVLGYVGEDTEIVVPSEIDGLPVCHIGKSFIEGNREIISVVIPNTVLTIGIAAFRNCFYLDSVTLPKGISEIPRFAFEDCSELKSIEIGSNVTLIDENAFYGCCKLNNVVIPSNVKKINNRAFDFCTSLTSITLSEGLESIGDEVFMDCMSLESIKIPNSVKTNLGGGVFSDCSVLKNVKLPDGLTRLPAETFSCCFALDKVELPDTVTAIGRNAFENTAIESLNLSENICSIEKGAFNECASLKTVVIDGYIGKIDDSVFEGCSALESVKLNHNISSIGKEAFSGCKSLTDVDIHLYDTITSIGEGCFKNCQSLKAFKLPSRITKIEKETFEYCASLESIEIGGMVTSIDGYAFYKCTSLKSAGIPNSVTTIGEAAFDLCEALETVKLPNKLTSIGAYVFSGCASLKNIVIPDTVTEIKNGAFASCTSLENLALPEKIRTIGEYAFMGCPGFEELVFPQTLSTIGTAAFVNCSDIKEVYFLNKSTAINSYSFGYSKNGKEDFAKAENPPTIYGYYGSTAAAYAGNNGLNFVEMNSNPPGVQTVINLDSDTIELDKTRMKKIGFTVTNSGGQTRFESTDTSIATVDSSGRVRGVSEGTAYIVIVNANATVLLTVNVHDSDVDITQEQQNSEFKYTFIEDENGEISAKITGYIGDGGKVVIPAEIDGYHVDRVGTNTFKDCLNVTELEVAEGVGLLEYDAVSGCENVRKIKFPETINLESSNFSQLKKVEVIEYSNLEKMMKYCKYGARDIIPTYHPYTLVVDGIEMSDIVIPESISVVPAFMFANCTNIKSVVLSENTTEIEICAFQDCVALESVALPEKQMYLIGGYSFSGCESLTEITLPNYIGTLEKAFTGTSITSIRCNNINTLTDSAFSEMPKLEIVYLKAKNFYDFYYGAFADSPALKEIHFDEETAECSSDILKNMTASPTIYGAAGSSIERAAREMGLEFIAINSVPTEPMTSEPPTVAPIQYPTSATDRNVIFVNNKGWSNVNIFVFNSSTFSYSAE